MIVVKRASSEMLDEVYKWYRTAEKINQKNYEEDHLNIFFYHDFDVDEDSLRKALEDQENAYFYLAYEDHEIVGIIYGYVLSLRKPNLNIPLIYAVHKDGYRALLDHLLEEMKDITPGIIKMRPVFPREKDLLSVLKEEHFVLRRTTYTMEDLIVEKRHKMVSYKISGLNKREVEEVQQYYNALPNEEKEFSTLQIGDYQKEDASRILIAKNKKKIVGLLMGTISSHRYVVSYLDICVGDNEQIRHDLLNEFKKMCLKEESDDILVETTNAHLRSFLNDESFIESRSTYIRKLQSE